MEVINNDQKLRICFMYNDSIFRSLLTNFGIEETIIAQFDNLSFKKQVEKFNELFPDSEMTTEDIKHCPDTTHCMVYEGKQVIATASVVRYYKDPEDRDKARKFALGKLLKQFYPNDKGLRTKFWDTYLNRGVTEPVVVPVTHPVGE